ncbi:MAG: flavin reductase [Armatimonadetes bacterium]|nr:flavin reductase [Armatimonadota bacterium]
MRSAWTLWRRCFAPGKPRPGRIPPDCSETSGCVHPPTILFCPPGGGGAAEKKDTLRNLEETREFVVNVVTEQMTEQTNRCATDYPNGVSSRSPG